MTNRSRKCSPEALNNCQCDICMGACSETAPFCGDCFACEDAADEEYSWQVNRADILQI